MGIDYNLCYLPALIDAMTPLKLYSKHTKRTAIQMLILHVHVSLQLNQKGSKWAARCYQARYCILCNSVLCEDTDAGTGTTCRL